VSHASRHEKTRQNLCLGTKIASISARLPSIVFYASLHYRDKWAESRFFLTRISFLRYGAEREDLVLILTLVLEGNMTRASIILTLFWVFLLTSVAPSTTEAARMNRKTARNEVQKIKDLATTAIRDAQ
jgi:hypothetical protein